MTKIIKMVKLETDRR